MDLNDFWRRLQHGIEVAVSGPHPDKLLGVRDGFQRYFRQRLDRPVSIAVVPQDEDGDDAGRGMAISDDDAVRRVEAHARALAERLGDTYHFYVASDGALHSVGEGAASRWFVRNWTGLVSPFGASLGASGSVQLPERLIEGLGEEQISFAVPGTRRRGGMIASLTGGLESRRSAVALATVHALSTHLYGILASEQP